MITKLVEKHPAAAIAAVLAAAYLAYLLFFFPETADRAADFAAETELIQISASLEQFRSRYGAYPNPGGFRGNFPAECRTASFRGMLACLSGNGFGKAYPPNFPNWNYCVAEDGQSYGITAQGDGTSVE